MLAPRARFTPVLLFILLLLSFSIALAQEQTVFSSRSGDGISYELSSAAVISPDLWADYFARDAWVGSETPVTVRVLDGGDFEVRVYGPNNYDTNWFAVTGSYVFTPTTPGSWRVMFGRVGFGSFLEDFVSVSTVPIQNVVVRLEGDVNTAVGAGLLPAEEKKSLERDLQTAEHRLEQGKRDSAANALQSFVSKVEADVASGTIKWSLGQLWINAANYVMQH